MFLQQNSPLSRLLSVPPGIHHLLEEHRWPILRVSSVVVKHLHDCQTSIDADEIGQLQWSHRHIRSVLHDRIDVLLPAHTSLEADNRLINVWHENTVCQETRRVGGDGSDLAHLCAEVDGGVEGGLRGLQTSDDLDALLNWDGVHEVGRHDAGRGGGVGWVFGRGGCDAGDGDGGGVGCEDGVGWSDLSELLEDLELELWDLWDGLDDEVDGGEVVHGCGWGQPGADLVGLLLGNALLGDILCEELVCKSMLETS